jgi:hypothetical protein
MAKHDGVLLTVAVPSSQIAALCYTFCSVNLERFSIEDLISLQELKGLFDKIVTVEGDPDPR